MLSKILLVFFIFLFVIDTKIISACQCQMQTDEQQFCSASFVLLATPTKLVKFREENSTQYGHNEYQLNIEKNFQHDGPSKHCNELAANSTITVISAPHDGVCGVNLKADGSTNYLISGVMDDKGMHISLCRWAKPWSNVNEKLKEKLEASAFNCTNTQDASRQHHHHGHH